MKPATVGLIKQSNQLDAKLSTKLGALGRSLVEGNLNGVNFAKIGDLLEQFEEVNNTLLETKSVASSGIYQSYAGKFLSTALKIGTVVVFLGCVGVIIYEEIDSTTSDSSGMTNSTSDSSGGGSTSGFVTTLTAVGAGITQLVNDMFKNYSDTESQAIEMNPPRSKTQVNAIKDIFQNIMTMLEKTGPEASEALDKYKAAYPLLPSKIQKLFPNPQYWHMDLVEKAQNVGRDVLGTKEEVEESVEVTVDRDDAESGDQDPQMTLSPGSTNQE